MGGEDGGNDNDDDGEEEEEESHLVEEESMVDMLIVSVLSDAGDLISSPSYFVLMAGTVEFFPVPKLWYEGQLSYSWVILGRMSTPATSPRTCPN